MAVRYTGRLLRWNAERGFGFVAADDGGAELFLHITAFAHYGPPPAVGDALSFEVEPDRDGKRRAVRALRSGEQAASAAAPRRHTISRAHKGSGTSFLGRVMAAALVCALVWFGYSAYTKRAAKFDSFLPTLPAVMSPTPAQAPALSAPVPLLSGKLPVPADFRCDGRSMCSQMTSCREATLFLQNCPGMKMDGNGDGVPCEQQWCTQ
jgi:cold shock CspA family protein